MSAGAGCGPRTVAVVVVVMWSVLDGLTVRLDGKPAASSVVSRRRKILITAIEYTVERKLLAANPLPALKWKKPRPSHVVDGRSVANPVQARTLLAAVRSSRTGRAWWRSSPASTSPAYGPRRRSASADTS